jgi:hypothetical protein
MGLGIAVFDFSNDMYFLIGSPVSAYSSDEEMSNFFSRLTKEFLRSFVSLLNPLRITNLTSVSNRTIGKI